MVLDIGVLRRWQGLVSRGLWPQASFPWGIWVVNTPSWQSAPSFLVKTPDREGCLEDQGAETPMQHSCVWLLRVPCVPALSKASTIPTLMLGMGLPMHCQPPDGQAPPLQHLAKGQHAVWYNACLLNACTDGRMADLKPRQSQGLGRRLQG